MTSNTRTRSATPVDESERSRRNHDASRDVESAVRVAGGIPTLGGGVVVEARASARTPGAGVGA
jgi:hypothetical protein